MSENKTKVWECKIGFASDSELEKGADYPMREVVQAAFKQLVGREADFCFSGWAVKLTESEAECVNEYYVTKDR